MSREFQLYPTGGHGYALRAGSLKLDDFVAYRVSRDDNRSVVKKIEILPDDFDVYEMWEKGLSVE